MDTQGDAFFVAFPSAPQALSAAAETTRVLAAHAWPDGATLDHIDIPIDVPHVEYEKPLDGS